MTMVQTERAFTLRTPAWLIAQADIAAAAEGKTRSQWIREAIRARVSDQ